LIGIKDLDSLLYTAAEIIRQHIPNANLTFFLHQEEDYRAYAFESENSQKSEKERLEQYFNGEVVKSVMNSGKLCKMEDLLFMGLGINPATAKNISAVTIPIEHGLPCGFLLLYTTSGPSLDKTQLDKLFALRHGLWRAVKSCNYTQSID